MPVIGVVAVVAGLFGFVPSASAQLSPTQSRVTLVHAIIGVPVDVYVNGALVSDADGFAPTEFLALPPLEAGSYAALVYAHTVTPAPPVPPAGDPVISQTLTVPAGVNLSVVAASIIGPSDIATPQLVSFVNDLTIAPDGLARVSVRHVANADAVDVYADGVKIVDALPSGAKSDLLVPADTYTIEVYETGAEPGVDDPVAPAADIDLAAGRLEAIYVGGDLDGSIPLTVFTRDPAIPATVTLLNLVPGATIDVSVTAPAPGGTVVNDLAPFTTYAIPGGLAGVPTTFTIDDGGGPVAFPVTFAANTRYSVVYGLDDDGDPALTAFSNDIGFAEPGTARVSIRHVAETGEPGGPVDVYVGDITTPVVAGLENGDFFEADIDAAGTLPPGAVIVVPAGEDPVGPATPKIVNTAPITINAGQFVAIYAAGSVPDGTAQLFVRSLALQRLVNPVTPTRILDTRDGTGTPAGEIAPLSPGEVLKVSVAGVGGVPNTGAGAAILNVTAANTTADGYLTVYPCDDVAPETSNVNFVADQAGEPNAVLAALNLEGDVCITTYAETDVIVDVNGWFTLDAGYAAQTPERILDTRDGTGTPEGQLLPGEILEIPFDAPFDVAGLVLNVTAANTTEAGYLTVFPCAEDEVPYASNVNYEAGSAGTPNAVITGVGDGNTACVITSEPVDVIVDLQGVLGIDSGFLPFTPERIYDTRDGYGGAPIGTLDPGETATIQAVAPEDVTLGGINAVVLNVTATEAEADGYLTVFPCNVAQPYASSVNYTVEELSSPNAVVIGTSPTGTVCITSYASVDVVVDRFGAFAG